MKTYGYARVSSADQHADRQIAALVAAGVVRENIYTDRRSGRDFARPAWRRLMRNLRKGDLLVVQSIDRMGRNYDEMQEEWRRITKSIGADVQVLDMALLDTRLHRDLLGTLIADLVLKILAYALAPNIPLFFAARVLQAPSYALYTVLIVGYADRTVARKDSAKAQSLAFSMTTIGSVLASLIGGPMFDSAGVRPTMLTAAAIAAVGAVIALAGTRGKKEQSTLP